MEFMRLLNRLLLSRNEKIINVSQQLIDLFNREELLAFFDFELQIGIDDEIAGLCKISKPKVGESNNNYLSLLMVIDAVDDKRENEVDLYIQGISWHGIARYLPEIEMIVPMPHVRYETCHYIQEIDIYFKANMKITIPYLSNIFYPVIIKIISCKSRGLSIWDEPA